MSSDVQGRVLPVYFVADESGSMESEVGILTRGLVELYDAMQTQTLAASKVRFTVLGFSNSTRVALNLAQLAEIEPDELPAMMAAGGTSYRAVFNDLLGRLPADVAQLKRQGFQVHKPSIFFLTDGSPNRGEDWESSHRRLTAPDFRENPNILAFGVRDARAPVIAQLATRPEWAFIAEEGADTGAALLKFMVQLTHSVVESGRAVASGDAELRLSKPDDFRVAVPLI